MVAKFYVDNEKIGILRSVNVLDDALRPNFKEGIARAANKLDSLMS